MGERGSRWTALLPSRRLQSNTVGRHVHKNVYCCVMSALTRHRRHGEQQRADEEVRKACLKEAGLGCTWIDQRKIKGPKAFQTG